MPGRCRPARSLAVATVQCNSLGLRPPWCPMVARSRWQNDRSARKIATRYREAWLSSARRGNRQAISPVDADRGGIPCHAEYRAGHRAFPVEKPRATASASLTVRACCADGQTTDRRSGEARSASSAIDVHMPQGQDSAVSDDAGKARGRHPRAPTKTESSETLSAWSATSGRHRHQARWGGSIRGQTSGRPHLYF